MPERYLGACRQQVLSECGPTRKWLRVPTTSAFWGTPDLLCSPRALPVVSGRPEESHPRALPKPCVNLSIHTAPDVRPLAREPRLHLVHGLLLLPDGVSWPVV